MIDADAHLFHGPQIADLITKEALTKVTVEYADFAFSPDLVSKLPKHTGINDYAIKLVDINGFIRSSKSPTDAPIFFERKLDRSFLIGCQLERSLQYFQPCRFCRFQWPIRSE